jgi:hypothetical protein
MPIKLLPKPAPTPPPPADEAQKTKRQRRRIFVLILLVSLGVHGLAGLIAAGFIIARYLAPPPAVFVAKKTVTIPPRQLEQKMAAAEFEAMSSTPAFDDKIASTRATADLALPDLPKMPVDDMMPMDPSLITDQITSVVGSGGMGSGGGAGGDGSGLGGLGGDGESFSFFGIKTAGKSVVILFDISQSVLTKATRAGVPIEKIKEETKTLLAGLSVNTRFGLIQFSRGYLPFKNELSVPTDAVRQEVATWMDTEFRTTGSLSGRGVVQKPVNGIESVLDAAFAMNPDVIFIISDGDFQRGHGGGGAAPKEGGGSSQDVPLEDIEKLVSARQKERPEPVKINFVGFQMKPQHKDGLTKIVRRSHGTLKEIGP